jgi:hydroxymethylbilane synthase
MGSRGSTLALWQSNFVKSRLERAHAGLEVMLTVINTTGDKQSSASLAKIGGKGVFTKELEEALLDLRIDLAVHSLKDLPTTLQEGLHLAAITEREDASDALVVQSALSGSVRTLTDLPIGSSVGTSSLRRAAQLRHLRSDLKIVELRGNVETRLKKLDAGNYDAIILASAGLVRLGFAERITERIAPSVMLTAVGQGALAVESRTGDERVAALLGELNHRATRVATEAERAVLNALGGGCAVPVAAHAWLEDTQGGERLVIDALVAEVNGEGVIRQRISGEPEKAGELGRRLAQRLIAAGADRFLDGFDREEGV